MAILIENIVPYDGEEPEIESAIESALSTLPYSFQYPLSTTELIEIHRECNQYDNVGSLYDFVDDVRSERSSLSKRIKDSLNQQFCRARYGGQYNTKRGNKELWFRISSTGYNWVNDIYIHGRKAVGILTEGLVNMEEGGLSSAVVGIGVNLRPGAEPIPDELKDRMIYLYPASECPITRAELASRIADEVLSILDEDFIDEYRSRCFILGSAVTVIRNGLSRAAVALDVDDHAHLVVRYLDGSIEALSSGEVTLRI